MPIFRSKNEKLFEKWSPKMAYALGYILADGSLYQSKRGAHFLDLQSIDRELIFKLKDIFEAGHKVSSYLPKGSTHKRYRLQIGSKDIFADLAKLDIHPKKTGCEKLPKVPDKYFADFLRGYFDGDGDVTYGFYQQPARKSKSKFFAVRFTSGGSQLLKQIRSRLSLLLGTTGSIYFTGGAW